MTVLARGRVEERRRDVTDEELVTTMNAMAAECWRNGTTFYAVSCEAVAARLEKLSAVLAAATALHDAIAAKPAKTNAEHLLIAAIRAARGGE